MHIEDFREYCLKKKGITEEFPFNETTLVFKVMGKMFALTDIEHFSFINLKCDPERAVLLREAYPGIEPGYHMHKKSWNSVMMDGSIPDRMIREMIDDSYNLIARSLSKNLKENLDRL